MNVGTVNNSLVQLQTPSVAAGSVNKTARNLQKTTPASADTLEGVGPCYQRHGERTLPGDALRQGYRHGSRSGDR